MRQVPYRRQEFEFVLEIDSRDGEPLQALAHAPTKRSEEAFQLSLLDVGQL